MIHEINIYYKNNFINPEIKLNKPISSNSYKINPNQIACCEIEIKTRVLLRNKIKQTKSN